MKPLQTTRLALKASVISTLLALAPAASAVEFTGSGFFTLAAGKVLSGSSKQNVMGYNCPCFISDYAQAGVYQNNGWDWKPDSKLGLQGTAKLSNDFSVTSQVVFRGARDGNPNLEWIYGSYKINDKLTLQVGRKRVPFFSYSESQDVGFTYPWVHLPPQMYGWEIVNYNGANLMYRDNWGDWAANVNILAGQETKKNVPYQEIYWGKNTNTDTRWGGLRGIEVNLSKDWFEARALYLETNTQSRGQATSLTIADPNQWSDKAKRKTYGVSFSADYENWVLRSEFLYINARADYGGDRAQLYAAGYRFGKWLPMLTYANYKQFVLDKPGDFKHPDQAEGHSTVSLSLRYDLTSSSAVKVQLDHWQDHSGPLYNNMDTSNPFAGNTAYGSSNLLSVSYDKVF